jgi:hypothetical protein
MTLLTSLFFCAVAPVLGERLPRRSSSWTSPNDLTDAPVFFSLCDLCLEIACRDVAFPWPPLVTLLTSLFLDPL